MKKVKLNYKALHNQVDKKVLRERLALDNKKRKTVSFYRYVDIVANQTLRDEMYITFFNLEVLGRIYLANEGINAQVSVLEENYEEFLATLEKYSFLKKIPIKIALEENITSFFKLVVKVRRKIVADGIPENEINFSNVGKHLSAEEFNQGIEDGESIVVDVRNHYESEVGCFKKALTVDSDTFREQLPMIKSALEDKLAGDKKKPVLLYCTGGIRCEKASAYLKHHGFENVGQLHGGIIQYTQEVKKKNLDNKFRGKNFVFDNRLGEKVSDEIISKCHQCGDISDQHRNCKNDDCHLLFIQCDHCAEKWEECCSTECIEISRLPIEEQRKLRKELGARVGAKEGVEALKIYKSRLRPKLTKLKE